MLPVYGHYPTIFGWFEQPRFMVKFLLVGYLPPALAPQCTMKLAASQTPRTPKMARRAQDGPCRWHGRRLDPVKTIPG